ncbi:YjaG family protein [Thalassotalea litorea]|uniref:YjaG family protein n=1 Tax=Thalassotalea litorea TaxID=2020715 RepID=UPI003735AEDC
MPNPEKLTQLTLWQLTAYSAALIERMLPNYQMFSEASEFGDTKLLRNQLDLVWQRLAQPQFKLNFSAQLEKLEEVIPNVEDFDFFGVYPALDTCMAIGSLLQGMQDKDLETLTNVSLLSKGSVSYYLELMLAEEQAQQNPDVNDEIIIQQADIEAHPLMQWEMETQQELLAFALTAKENKETCQQLKSMALSEGMSNLGIEI